MNSRFRRFAVAIAVAVLYGAIIYGLTQWLHPGEGLLLAAFLFGVPATAPSLAVMIVDPRCELDETGVVWLTTLVLGVMFLFGILVLKEGSICLVMAAPIFIGASVLGVTWTRMLLRKRFGHFCLALIALPVLAIPADSNAAYPSREESVMTVRDIDAPPAQVWRNIIQVRDIKPGELGWTFTQDVAGVPKPLDARLVGVGVGAVREVTWGKGVRFQERISRWIPNKFLEWNFAFGKGAIPATIEAHLSPDSGYLKVASGSYKLDPLPGNRTRLTLTTRYWMRTPLNAYCAWWGRIFIGDFHRNVLRVIRGRSESTMKSVQA